MGCLVKPTVVFVISFATVDWYCDVHFFRVEKFAAVKVVNISVVLQYRKSCVAVATEWAKTYKKPSFWIYPRVVIKIPKFDGGNVFAITEYESAHFVYIHIFIYCTRVISFFCGMFKSPTDFLFKFL